MKSLVPAGNYYADVMRHAAELAMFEMIIERMGPSFEEYLVSKKIDSDAFRLSEPEVWNGWKKEFEQVHPNSFTLQKLNLINPVRRKYWLQPRVENKPEQVAPSGGHAPSSVKAARPVIRPRIEPGSSNTE